MRVGIVIKTDEKIENFEDLINKVDKVILMGTKLGVKGKEFEKKILIEIEKLKSYIRKINKSNIAIEVDGGIREYSVPLVVNAGADSVVAGSLIFNEEYKKISKWIHSL